MLQQQYHIQINSLQLLLTTTESGPNLGPKFDQTVKSDGIFIAQTKILNQKVTRNFECLHIYRVQLTRI